MSFVLIDTIRESLTALFGQSLMVPILIVGVISIILLSIKGGKVLLVSIVVPLILTLVTFGVSEIFNFGNNDFWIIIAGAIALAVTMASAFWAITR